MLLLAADKYHFGRRQAQLLQAVSIERTMAQGSAGCGGRKEVQERFGQRQAAKTLDQSLVLAFGVG